MAHERQMHINKPSCTCTQILNSKIQGSQLANIN